MREFPIEHTAQPVRTHNEVPDPEVAVNQGELPGRHRMSGKPPRGQFEGRMGPAESPELLRRAVQSGLGRRPTWQISREKVEPGGREVDAMDRRQLFAHLLGK